MNRSADDQPMRMVRLMTAADAFGAKVVVAQLGVEGILWELKGGGVDGPYPFGPVQVLVAEADLAQAQAVLASTAPLDADRDEQDELDDLEALWAPRRSRRTVLSAAAVLGLLALVAAELVRLLVIS